MRAVLSTGSNMDNPRAQLASVTEDFATELLAQSPMYATAPWGGVEQDDFLNQILIVEVEHTPLELLQRCQEIEHRAHRVREIRWGPRTLDVDIIDIPGYTSSDPQLEIPHPRAYEREFVLRPWLDVDPEAQLGGRSVAQLLDQLEPQGVRRL